MKSFLRFLEALFGRKPRTRLGYSVGRPQLKRKHTPMLELTITNEEQVVVHLLPTTDAGNPTTLDGVPGWLVISGPAKVVPAADGLSATLISSDTDLSDTVIQVSGDADLGSGVEEVADVITLHTKHANAKRLGLFADKPVLKVPAAPTP